MRSGKIINNPLQNAYNVRETVLVKNIKNYEQNKANFDKFL